MMYSNPYVRDAAPGCGVWAELLSYDEDSVPL
jgi:hypothetical protein